MRNETREMEEQLGHTLQMKRRTTNGGDSWRERKKKNID